MPARSNAFQRMVRAIHGHVSRVGTVTESKMLPDKDTGSLVEVDVVIEETVGGHRVLIGIECTAGKRKATIEWYREMLSKHAGLAISKTVLVSESGFTREVHRKAKVHNVELLTLGQAQTCNWHTLIGKLKSGTVADVEFRLETLSVIASADAESIEDLQRITPDNLLHVQGKVIPLGLLAVAVAKQLGVTKAIMARLGQAIESSSPPSFRFQVPPDAYIQLGAERIGVREVQAVLTIHPRFQPISWRSIELNGRAVAAGSFPAEFLFKGATGETVVTASSRAEGDLRVTVLDPNDNDIQLECFPHALWQAKP